MVAISNSAVVSGTLGAMVGGTVSAVSNSYKVARGEMNPSDAISNVAKEAVGTGISTATAGATVTALGLGGFLGLVGFLIVASFAKGLLDSAFQSPPKKPAMG
jgi:hypothetical protein